MGISIRRAKDMGSVSLSMPTGIVNPFAGATAPSGWLLCDGTEKAIASYPELYSLLTTIYGALTNGSGGAGSTHFRVPDLRGRAVAGLDNMGGSAASRLTSTVLTASNTLGATGGTQTHTLTSGESGLVAHNHTINHDHGAFNATSGGMSANVSHTHAQVLNGAPTGGSLDGTKFAYGTIVDNANRNVTISSANTEHAHTTSIDVPNFTGTSGINTAANASSAHLNTQPTIVLNYIIKA